MAKQCAECGTMAENRARQCEACYGRTWKVPARTWARIRQFTTTVIVIAFLAGLVWLALHRR